MSKTVDIQILSNGNIRIKRGDKAHNEAAMKILEPFIGEDKKAELSEFFKGSEDVELLVGDTILCG